MPIYELYYSSNLPMLDNIKLNCHYTFNFQITNLTKHVNDNISAAGSGYYNSLSY